MGNYNAVYELDNPVEFFHYISPPKKLVCASYDPESGILSKTYAVLRTNGKRHTIQIKQRLNANRK